MPVLLSALSLLLSLVLFAMGIALLILTLRFLWSVPNHLRSIAQSLEEMNASQGAGSLEDEDDMDDEDAEHKYYS